MRTTPKYMLAGLIGLVIGAAVIYWFVPSGPRVVTDGSCPNVLPAANTSNDYGIYLTDDAGGPQVAIGYVHFYNTPGGFKHNIAITINSNDNSDSQNVTVGDMGSGCITAGSQGSQTATMKMTQLINGVSTQVSSWTFSPSTASGASFNVAVTPSGTTPLPPIKMSGHVYAMQ